MNDGAIHIRSTTVIERSPAEVYAVWRDPRQLTQGAGERVSVSGGSEDRYHWSVRAAGRTFEWDAKLVADEPARELRWQSLPGADVANSGAVHFAPRAAGQATEVSLTLSVQPPGGLVGVAAGKLLHPTLERETAQLLERLKHRLEAASG